MKEQMRSGRPPFLDDGQFRGIHSRMLPWIVPVNQKNPAAAKRPTAPSTMNACRQLMKRYRLITIKGETAPPQRPIAVFQPSA
jgi:hypothetical protein